jgi:hypothetical protein
MATNALELVNAAFGYIGENPITQADLITPPAANRQAVVAAREYAPAVAEEQRLHPWVFTLVRATLTAYTAPAATLTPAAVTGTGITFTASADAFVTADIGKTLEHVVGDGIALITAVPSPTTATATITEDFPSTGAIASGDWRMYYAAPAFSYARRIPVPTGCLRLLRVRHQVPYRAEGAWFVTDADSLDVVYLSSVTTTTLFDPAFDEVLKARLAMKFCYAITGKLPVLEAMTQLYQLALQRAKEAFALEQGEGEWEENPADDTQATIIQDAISRLVAQSTQGTLDPIDLTATANRLYVNARDELQRMHPWRFTRQRTRLDATTTTSLVPGAGAGTVNTTGVTFTTGADFFEATDIGLRLLGTDGGAARITGFTSTTVVTATIEGVWAPLVAVAAGDWHRAPSWRWTYRYPKPEGFLRLLETQTPTYFGGEPVSWAWWSGWRWPVHTGTGQPFEEPAVLEGEWLQSDAGPTLNIEYVERVTDAARFEPSYASVLAAFLAWRMAFPVTKQANVEQIMGRAFAAQLKSVRTADKHDTRVPPMRYSPLTMVRY